MASATDRILQPYTPRVDTSWTRWRRAALLTLIGTVGFFLGMFVALFPVQMLVLPAIPITAMLALALWMAPELDFVPKRTLRAAFFTFLGAVLIWPVYIAFDLPGLPWITPSRLALFVILSVLLTSIAMSKRMRTDILDSARSSHPLFVLLVLWLVAQAITLPLSKYFSDSVNHWMENQVYCTTMVFASAWLFAQRGMALRASRFLIFGGIVVAAIGVPEYIQNKVFWAEHIPSFMAVDQKYTGFVLGAQARSADGLYRVRSVFTVSLILGEFLSIILPFLLHALVTTTSGWRKLLLAAAWVLFAVVAFLTNARSAVIGLLLSHVTYGAMWSVWRRKTNPTSIMPAAIQWSYPLLATAFIGAVLSSQRLYNRTVGTGATQASNDGRSAQFANMWPKLFRNPFGYGAGQATDKVGVVGANDIKTIDSYILNLLMDYGVFGFVVFTALMVTTVLVGARIVLTSRDRELALAGPAALAIINFIVIKCVLSAENNHYLIFMLIGMVMGLYYQWQRADDSLLIPDSARRLDDSNRTKKSLLGPKIVSSDVHRT